MLARLGSIVRWLGCAGLLVLAGCTNDPYPEAEKNERALYSSFPEAPKTLDPAVAYTTAEHVVLANVFDSLLEYHYLKRPYQLMPGLAEAVPETRRLDDGREVIRFRLRKGILFHRDPCFALSRPPRETREVTAADVAFQIARLADPEVNSPASSSFAQVLGFTAFTKRLTELRQADAAFAKRAAHEQYKAAGGIAGVIVRGDHELDIVLTEPNAQLLYWFAMPFTTPMPWEAVAYYDGKEGRANFADQVVGTGPYRLALYDKQHRFELARNDDWYGTLAANADAPGVAFPTEIDPQDIADKVIDAAYAGRRMPFLDRITFTKEKESIPRFNKFLQGYYDESGIIKESFDAVVQSDRLSPEMAARGMRLDKTVEPTVFYIGFNMDDATVGTPAGDRGRRLRQAMSLAIDSKQYLDLFMNGRGVPAQSPLPPGIAGYIADYQNPFRRHDLTRTRALLAEAGYRNGIDPATGRPLRLTFDTPNTSAQAMLQFQYFAAAWRELGLDVEVAATTYNQFQDKMRRGAFQLFTWGWHADYPDAENFLSQLECENARSKSGGTNTANFCDPEYNRLYLEMKNLPSDEQRMTLIRRMLAILERERPWIELYHLEDYTLSHAWVTNSKPMGLAYPVYKYKDVNPELRARLQAEWNAPVRWPLYAGLILIVALTLPAIRTYYRERQ